MLTNPVFNQLKSMKLDGMAQALLEQQQDKNTATLSFDERFALLVDHEHSWNGLADRTEYAVRIINI